MNVPLQRGYTNRYNNFEPSEAIKDVCRSEDVAELEVAYLALVQKNESLEKDNAAMLGIIAEIRKSGTLPPIVILKGDTADGKTP